MLDQENAPGSADLELPSARKADLKIICSKHASPGDPSTKTNVYAYLRSKTGLTCCGNESKSAVLTGRVFSDETVRRMAESAQKRERTGSQDIRDSGAYKTWRKTTVQKWNSICQVRGVQPKFFVAHHFFSMTHFPSLQFTVENGIVLDDAIHNIFHQIYGFKKPVTLDCFIMFVNDLLADENFRLTVLRFLEASRASDMGKTGEVSSSSGDSQGVGAISSQTADAEGSETKALEVETLKRLHEHLVQLHQVFDSCLTPDESALKKRVRQRIDGMSIEQRTTFDLKPRTRNSFISSMLDEH